MPIELTKLQGKLYLGELNANDVPDKGFFWVGNTTNFTVRKEVERISHRESYTGLGLKDVDVPITNAESISFVVDEVLDADFLAVALQGTATKVLAGSVTAEAGITFQSGKTFFLGAINVSGVAIKKGATTLNTADYVLDAKAGSITFVTTAPQTAGLVANDALTADYTKVTGGFTKVSSFTTPAKNYAVRLAGVNQADLLKPVVYELYKVSLNPVSEIGLINTDWGQMPIEGMGQITSARTITDTADGIYSRMMYV